MCTVKNSVNNLRTVGNNRDLSLSNDDAQKKMNLYFTVEFRTCLDLFSTSIGLRTCMLNLNMQCQRTIPNENTKNKPPSHTFSKIPRTWSFHVVVLQRTAKKCTKNYNARAQLLFCSLNLLFCGVLVAVAVVVCLRSLILTGEHLLTRILTAG